MSFFNQNCPSCGKSISKDAEYCNNCGCPTANAWATCVTCGASVGEESQFCWKCGKPQDLTARRAIYGERWHRFPNDFATRVEITLPEKALQSGLQVDEGTLALLFQDGQYLKPLGPGYHNFSTFFERLVGADKGKAMHAILLDTKGADVNFAFKDIRAENQVPFDVNVRLQFEVTEPTVFVSQLVKGNSRFTTESLVSHFQDDVRAAVQVALKDWPLEKLMSEVRAREELESPIFERLSPLLEQCGLRLVAVRLANFGGESIEHLRNRFSQLDQLNREAELNQRLRDVLRKDKVAAFRDEKDVADAFETIAQEYGLKGEQRRLERERFLTAAQHTDRLDEIRRGYEEKQLDIENRLKLQVGEHAHDLAQVHHDLAKQTAVFDQEMRQKRRLQEEANQTAAEGIELLKKTNEAKFLDQKAKQDLELEAEERRLKLRENASVRTLLTMVPDAQGERLLKLIELENKHREEMLEKQSKLGHAEKEWELDLEGKRLRMRTDANLQALMASVPAQEAERLLKLAEVEMKDRCELTLEDAVTLAMAKIGLTPKNTATAEVLVRVNDRTNGPSALNTDRSGPSIRN